MSTVHPSDNETNSRDLVALGSRITAAREARALSIRRLAARVGVHHATISRIESGESERPTPEVLERLAQALEIPEADLHALAGYRVAGSLPAFPAYLRAKYDLPLEAAAQLTEYFDFIRSRYTDSADQPDAERSARDGKRPAA